MSTSVTSSAFQVQSELCRSRSDVSNGIVIVRLEPIQKLVKNPRWLARVAVSARAAMPIAPMILCWTSSTPAACAGLPERDRPQPGVGQASGRR
jgi:hypothetical protein